MRPKGWKKPKGRSYGPNGADPRCTARGRGIGKGGKCLRFATTVIVNHAGKRVGYSCNKHPGAKCFTKAIADGAQLL